MTNMLSVKTRLAMLPRPPPLLLESKCVSPKDVRTIDAGAFLH